MTMLRGKTAAITGAALGMGRLTAGKFAADGARVALLDIRREELESAVAEITAKGGTAKGYVCDLTKREEVYATFQQIERDLASVDILFNNAGVVFGGPLLETDDDKLAATINVNLMAQLWTMKAALPGMIRRNEGHIVNFASAAGLLGVPYLSAYCASKFGVIGLTEAMRMEMRQLQRSGIKFTLVTPSYVATGMFAGVKPPLLAPWLQPDDMAERIRQAVLKNKAVVRAPWIVNFVPLMAAVFPFEIVAFFAKALRMGQAMETWSGRQERLPAAPRAGS